MLFFPIRYINNGEPLDQVTLNRHGFDIQENLEKIIEGIEGAGGIGGSGLEASVEPIPNTLALRDDRGTSQFSKPIGPYEPLRLTDANKSDWWDDIINRIPMISNIGEMQIGNKLNFFKTNAQSPTMSVTIGNDDILHFGGRINVQDAYIRSDIRNKYDLVELTNALEKVSQLTGYDYGHTEFEGRSVGIIAQDLLKVLPNAVNEQVTDNGETRYNVQIAGVVALLVQAVNELSDKFNKHIEGETKTEEVDES